MDQILEQIARKELGIATLKTRNSDRLDFHEVSVESLRRALQAAYEAGQGKTKRPPLVIGHDKDGKAITIE